MASSCNFSPPQGLRNKKELLMGMLYKKQKTFQRFDTSVMIVHFCRNSVEIKFKFSLLFLLFSVEICQVISGFNERFY